MSILEELWYGNGEMLQLIGQNEDKMLTTITGTDKEPFAYGIFSLWLRNCSFTTGSVRALR